MPKVNQELMHEFICVMNKTRQFMHKLIGGQMDDNPTALQYGSLCHISEHPGQTVGQLAKSAMMSSGAVAQFIDRLESSGWIERIVDENDRRIGRLFITNEGRQELESQGKQLHQKMAEVFSRISEHDLRELIRIHKTLLANLERDSKND